MRVIGIFAAVVVLALVQSSQADESSLIGLWQCQKDCTHSAFLTITSANNGHFDGVYCYLGGSNKFRITGSYDQTGSKSGGTIAWAGVQSIDTKPPVRTWSGQRFIHNIPNSISDELIVATWLETRQTKYDDSWESTTIGKETFAKLMDQPFEFCY
jgi:hypothetical protein